MVIGFHAKVPGFEGASIGLDLFADGAPRLFFELGQLGLDVDVIGPSATIGRNAPLCVARDRPFSCDLPRSKAIPHELDPVRYLRRQMLQIGGSFRLIT